jgi:hypothetical protein
VHKPSGCPPFSRCASQCQFMSIVEFAPFFNCKHKNMPISNKPFELGLSSDIYDAAVAGMKKATRLNHNAAATRKPALPQNFGSLASLGPLFQSELKFSGNDSHLFMHRSSKQGSTPSSKHRILGSNDEKQADTEIVWPSVRFYNALPFIFCCS